LYSYHSRFPVLNILAKFRRGHALSIGALNAAGVYKFGDFRPMSGYM